MADEVKIPFYEPWLRRKYAKAAWKQMRSGWIGPGQTVGTFELQLREATGVRHVTACNSGTSALMLAIIALHKAGKTATGDMIACPDYGLPACQNAARFLQHKVRLVDVDPKHFVMSPDALGSALMNHPIRAVIFVNHNGYCGEQLEKIAQLCKNHRIPLIEDSAVGLGCQGSFQHGDMSILSFSVPKLLTTGQGGAVLTPHILYADKIREGVDHGGQWRQARNHRAIGVNFRMPDTQAAYGVSQLEDLPKLIAKRAHVWRWYTEEMDICQPAYPTGWVVTALVRDAANVVLKLHRHNIQAYQLYRPVHHHQPYKTDAIFPIAEAVYRQLIYLPSSLTLKRKQVQRICNHVRPELAELKL